MNKPKFEDIIQGLLDGDMLKNALDFYDFLKSHKMTPCLMGFRIYGSWTVKYKGEKVVYFRVSKGSWFIGFFGGYKKAEFGLLEKYENYLSDEGLKEFILTHISAKPLCASPSCKGDGIVKNKVILGKKFNTICACFPLYLRNPNVEALEYAKKIVLTNRNIVDDMV